MPLATNSFRISAVKDGDDAFTWQACPAPLVIQTDSTNGQPLLSGGANKITITATCGDNAATITMPTDDSQVTHTNCKSGSEGDGTTSLTILITEVTSETKKVLSDDGSTEKTIYIPATSGSVTFPATLKCGDRTATANITVAFTVDLKVQYAQLYTTQDSIIGRVTDISGDVTGVKAKYSEISQKASQISLKVGLADNESRNMLDRSQLRMAVTANTPQWTVSLLKTKNYAISARAMVNQALLDNSQKLRVYVYRLGSDGKTWAKSYYIDFTETYWVDNALVFTPDTSGTWYVYATIANEKGYGVTATDNGRGFVYWMQLEEAAEAEYTDISGNTQTKKTSTPWKPLTSDWDCQDDLVTEWTLAGTAKTKLPSGVTGTAAYLDNSAGTSNVALISATSANSFAMAAYATYTLSFYAKGSGTVKAYIGELSGSVSSDGQVSDIADGMITFNVTDGWKKHEVTFTCGSTSVTKAINAVVAGAKSTVYACQPKIEKGGTATDESTEKKLYDTGIDITNGKIVATADNFVVKNNDGRTTAAVDKNGNLVTGTVRCVGSVETNSDSGDEMLPMIDMSKGLFSVNGLGTSRMSFGVYPLNYGEANLNGTPYIHIYNTNGQLALSFDLSGLLTYATQASMTVWTMVDLDDIDVTEEMLTNLKNGIGWAEGNEAGKIFVDNNNYATTKIYQYHASKAATGYEDTDGYQPDKWMSAENARKYDGCFFTKNDFDTTTKDPSIYLISAGKSYMEKDSGLSYGDYGSSSTVWVYAKKVYTAPNNGYLGSYIYKCDPDDYDDIQSQAKLKGWSD